VFRGVEQQQSIRHYLAPNYEHKYLHCHLYRQVYLSKSTAGLDFLPQYDRSSRTNRHTFQIGVHKMHHQQILSLHHPQHKPRSHLPALVHRLQNVGLLR